MKPYVAYVLGCMMLVDSAIALADVRDATDAEAQLIEAAVRKDLKDPDSAKIDTIKINRQAGKAYDEFCGYVNSKNGNGGYMGTTRFYGLFGAREDGSPIAAVIGIAGLNDHGAVESMCVKAGIIESVRSD